MFYLQVPNTRLHSAKHGDGSITKYLVIIFKMTTDWLLSGPSRKDACLSTRTLRTSMEDFRKGSIPHRGTLERDPESKR
jgi:hypothetical protein